MPLTRQSLERQLQSANEDLEIRVSILKEKGVEESKYKQDPKWRHFNALCKQIRKRLRAVLAVEQREEECAARKTATASVDE